jgi:hypothetical protein
MLMSEPRGKIANRILEAVSQQSLSEQNDNQPHNPAAIEDQAVAAHLIRTDAAELAKFLIAHNRRPNTELELEVVKKNVREYPWLGRLSPTSQPTKSVTGPSVWMLHISQRKIYASIDNSPDVTYADFWNTKAVNGIGLTDAGKLVDVPFRQYPGVSHYDQHGHYVKHQSNLDAFTPVHSGTTVSDERLAPIHELNPSADGDDQKPVIEWRKRLSYFGLAMIQSNYYNPERQLHLIPEI